MKNEQIKLLILDDSKDFIFLLTELLRKYKIEAETESSAKEALLVANKSEFDLIITDYMMDTMDGISFAQEVRNNKLNANTKIMLLTAKDLEDDELLEVDKLKLSYVKKPISPIKLYKKILDIIKS